MLELAIKGSKKYYAWMTMLLAIIGVGFIFYLWQLNFGLGITGMSRDVSWGLYIAQLTFLVGVAASAVMVILPYYLHNYKAFGRIAILGEFLAVASVIMCLLFVLVDLGQPMRMLNMVLYPTPGSVLFWDMVVLNGYLFLNIIIGWNILESERNGVPPPCLGKAPDLSVDPVGGQHSYRNRFSVLWSAGKRLLAHGHPGAALSGVRLCRRTIFTDSALFDNPQADPL